MTKTEKFLSVVGFLLIIAFCLIMFSFTTYHIYPYAHDGDTIEIYDSIQHKQIGVRVANIDAPELIQPFGINSRDSLQQLISTSKLSIQVINTDKYQRKVGILRFNGGRYDSIAVLHGWVYVYAQYCYYPLLNHLQFIAQQNHVGIWNIQPQIKPWIFRNTKH